MSLHRGVHALQAVAAPQLAGTPNGAPAGVAVPAYLTALFDVIGKIGEGTYGVVYLARSKDPARPRLLAIKTFKPGKEGDGVSPTAIREIMLLRELHHANIVHLESVHICRKDPSLSLAFNYAEHDLYEMIRHHRDAGPGSGLGLYTLKSLLWQLLGGVAYLHAAWILHRDLKPSNVLVMGEGPEHGRVKVADFGLARVYAAPLRALADNGVVVTIWYRAPELLLGARHYTGACDVWAAGCCAAELLLLRPLFQGEERKSPGAAFQADQCERIFRVLGQPQSAAWPELEHLQHWRDNTANVRARKPEYPPAPRLADLLADRLAPLGGGGGGRGMGRGGALLDLLGRMLELNPARRITAAQALGHPWFQEEPLPGGNAFVQRGRVVAAYPRRTRHMPLSSGPAAAAAPAGSAAHAASMPAADGAPGASRNLTPQGVVRNTTPQGLLRGAGAPHNAYAGTRAAPPSARAGSRRAADYGLGFR